MSRPVEASEAANRDAAPGDAATATAATAPAGANPAGDTPAPGNAARGDTPAARLAATFKALGDPARVAIIAFLRAPQADCCSRGDGVCACDLEGVLGLSQPTVSHHMKLLVEAGLVRAEKRGRWVYYGLDHEAFDALSRDLEALHAPQLRLLQEV